MSQRVCPWWIGYLLACPLRRWFQNPVKILSPFVRRGMAVLEPGPGMGFFTLDLARMVGPSGRVVAVDIQPRMLDSLRKRARKAGLLGRIQLRLSTPDSLGVDDLAGQMDFVLAFALVHEMPSDSVFFREAARTMKPGASLLLAEPAGHVSTDRFAGELDASRAQGLEMIERPRIPHNLTALMRKP